MARGDQLGRQWKIIQTLISSGQGKSASELAQELECHPRTLYRDLEALQVAGFPIYSERSGGKNLWSLLDTVKHQIPVPFTHSIPNILWIPEQLGYWHCNEETRSVMTNFYL